MEYAHVAQQQVRVQAHVATTPDAKIGNINVCCVGAPVTEECVMKNNECVYTVRQLLYIEFPITISVHAEAEPAEIVCNQPSLIPSPEPVCGQLKCGRPSTTSQRRRRPLLFALLETLQKSLFPRRR